MPGGAAVMVLDVAGGAALLRGGGIVAYPTETFYGLGALASHGGALERLAAAKLRPEGKPLPLIAADEAQVTAVAVLEDATARALAARFWPGPLTLVLPARDGLHPIVTGGASTVGVRIPGHDVARALAQQAGGAIVSTSANLAGEPPVARAEQLSTELRSRIDGVVDGRPTPGGLPSTVVAVGGGRVALVREGAIPWSEIAPFDRLRANGGAASGRTGGTRKTEEERAVIAPLGSLRAPGECSTVRALMAEVLPFRGIRYAVSRPGPLSRLIAPPYDVISPTHRAELGARSPHNIVHLVLPEDRPGDGPTDNKYTRAGASFRAWLAEGVLRPDPAPAYYALEQSFTGPDGRPRVRRSLVGACRLHAYSERVILPHEKTLTTAKADRLELLRQVKATLSPVFALYEDESGEGHRALEAAIASAGDPIAEADTDDGTHHRVWRIESRSAAEPLHDFLAQRKLLIADGHHRYEAALVYRDEIDAAQPDLPDRAGHRYVVLTLCSMSDPGLVIYPTHRLVGGIPTFRVGALLDGLARFFVVDTLVEDLHRPAGRAWAVSKLAEHSGKSTAFLMVTAEDGKGRILTLRDDADLAGVALPSNVTLRDLDTTALHQIVFEHLLGISPLSQARGDNVRYEMDAGEVVSRTLDREYQLGFLVNPTPMWQVQAVAESGETMPTKSTFFYPKVPSGLVMRSVHELLAW